MSSNLPTASKEDRAKVKAHLKEVYDAYRLASMNCTYYQRRLKNVQRLSKFFEIVIAILSSSAVASWAIWKNPNGAGFWAALGIASCILSIMHPLFKLPDEIERLTKQRTGYNDLYHDLKFLVTDIHANRCLSVQNWKSFKSINERFKKLSQTDDPDPSKKKLKGIMREVLCEVPTDTLWYPKNPTP